MNVLRIPTLMYDIIAGSYLHLPIVGYNVNPYQLIDTKKRVEATQKILESKDQNQLKTLTREQILGELAGRVILRNCTL